MAKAFHKAGFISRKRKKAYSSIDENALFKESLFFYFLVLLLFRRTGFKVYKQAQRNSE